MREWPLDSSSLKSFTHWIYFLVTVTELLSYSIRVVVSLDRASLIAQLVKNLPAMRETWVQSLGWEDPLERGKATPSSILA